MKTLAIRLEDDQHAKLTMLARLAGVSVTDAIRAGVENQIEAMAADPQIAAKADELQAEIEREAREAAAALSAMFGTSKPKQPRTATPKTST